MLLPLLLACGPDLDPVSRTPLTPTAGTPVAGVAEEAKVPLDVLTALVVARVGPEHERPPLASLEHTLEVRLEVQGEDLLLTVQDNGKGKVEGGHLVGGTGCGVSNMRFRSQLLHAQLSFCENTPQGVKVICRIPSVIVHAN